MPARFIRFFFNHSITKGHNTHEDTTDVHGDGNTHDFNDNTQGDDEDAEYEDDYDRETGDHTFSVEEYTGEDLEENRRRLLSGEGIVANSFWWGPILHAS